MYTEDTRLSVEKLRNLKGFILLAIKPFKFLIIWQILVMLLLSVIEYHINPQLLRSVINKATHSDVGSSTVVKYILYYFILSIITAVLYRLSEWLWLKFNSPFQRALGTRLINIVMNSSSLGLGRNLSGNVINRLNNVINGLPDLTRNLSIVAIRIFSIVLSVLTIYSISYKFSILLVVWVSVFTLYSVFMLKRAHKLNYKAAKARSKVVGHMVDICNNLLNVQLCVSRDVEEKNVDAHLVQYVTLEQKKDLFFIKMFSFQALSFLLYQAIGFLLLVKGLHRGTVKAGDFALLTYTSISVLKALWIISGEIIKISDIMGRVVQGLDLVLPLAVIRNNLNANKLIVTKGRIVFVNVHFNHEEAEALFFENQSIIIEPGEKVGLVGYSGSGKTTFLNLILRIYDIKQGVIQIDDQNINHLSKDSLRQSICMIPQEPLLFHRSIIENIKYGNPDATNDQAIEVAKLVQAHDFIIHFAHGYGEIVGERGMKLSGGQRQLIVIARAILKKSPILIMDEATSQLDSITELKVQNAISIAMKNRTTLVAAHRLSTLRAMDRILVFDKGKIIEANNHQNLIKDTESLYYKMWHAQVESCFV